MGGVKNVVVAVSVVATLLLSGTAAASSEKVSATPLTVPTVNTQSGDIAGVYEEGSIDDYTGDSVVVTVDSPDAARFIAANVEAVDTAVETDLFVSLSVPKDQVDLVQDLAVFIGSDTQIDPVVSKASFLIPNDTLWPLWYGGIQGDMQTAYGYTTGSADVIIAILDTGVVELPELEGRVLPGKSFFGSGTGKLDLDGHGTMAAQVAAGAVNNRYGAAGTCPRCTILPVQVFDPANVGSTTSLSVVAAGIIWAADNDADIINMSLGGPSSSPNLEQAAQYAQSKGVLMIASAGNQGTYACTPGRAIQCGADISYPAGLPEILSVAAGNEEGTLYDYSSYWDGINVIAPGTNIAENPTKTPGSFYYFTGTSSAAPFVAGSVGLYLSLVPEATQTQVWADLQATSTNPGQLISSTWGHVRPGALITLAGATPDTPNVSQVYQQTNSVVVSAAASPTGVPANSLTVKLSPTQQTCVIQSASGTCIIGSVTPGEYQVTVQAVNGAGSSAPSAPANITVRSGAPVGELQNVTQGAINEVRVQGWVLDFDTVNSAVIKIAVNGEIVTQSVTGSPSPQINALYPGYTGTYNYDTTFTADTGRNSVCVTAVNVGTGADTSWCRTLLVTAPAGDVPASCGFTDEADIPAWAKVPTCWAKAQGVTTVGTYRPADAVTRAQMATFLWNAAGNPPAATSCGFADEASISNWAKAATCWAKAQGITTADPYRPADAVTRAQMATFLWNAAGNPPAATTCGFTDEASIPNWAKEATCWAKAQGITTVNTYRPNDRVIRAEMAAFLYRIYDYR